MIVTPLELPYEKPVYEGPVYPGTLTCYEAVPNIKSVRPVSDGGEQEVAGDIGLTNSSYAIE
jgi:hypothetical protein